VGYTLLIVLLSHWSSPTIPSLLAPLGDKVLHGIQYAVLGFLWCRFVGGPAGTRVFLGWAAAALFGITDELHQLFVVGRVASVLDWGADCVGALAGAAAAVYLPLPGRARAKKGRE
jgi:VanZ family protein